MSLLVKRNAYKRSVTSLFQQDVLHFFPVVHDSLTLSHIVRPLPCSPHAPLISARLHSGQRLNKTEPLWMSTIAPLYSTGVCPLYIFIIGLFRFVL